MSDPKKFSIQEVRAAKERIVKKTAVRPAARPVATTRPGWTRSVILVLGASSAVAAFAAVGARASFDRAMVQALANAQDPYAGESAALTPLASDRDFEKLLELFKPPARPEWAEVEATARLKRTGNSSARKLAGENAGFLAELRRQFPMEAPGAADLFRDHRTLLNGRHDAGRLRELLIAAVAMGHFLLDSGAGPEGEAVLFATIRAAQTVSRGLGGRYQAAALEMGQLAATLARLSLVSHAYGGTLPAGDLDRLPDSLRATLAYEPDYRRVLIAQRDRSMALADTAREGLGILWMVGELRGFADPAGAIAACQSECAKALQGGIAQAAAEISDSAARLAGPDAHPLAQLGGAGPALHPAVVSAQSAAQGAVAAALLVVRLARDPTPPDDLENLGLRLPKDPVSGSPFRYQRAGRGFRFWGVGADGKDDGGDEAKDVLLLDAGGR